MHGIINFRIMKLRKVMRKLQHHISDFHNTEIVSGRQVAVENFENCNNKNRISNTDILFKISKISQVLTNGKDSQKFKQITLFSIMNKIVKI